MRARRGRPSARGSSIGRIAVRESTSPALMVHSPPQGPCSLSVGHLECRFRTNKLAAGHAQDHAGLWCPEPSTPSPQERQAPRRCCFREAGAPELTAGSPEQGSVRCRADGRRRASAEPHVRQAWSGYPGFVTSEHLLSVAGHWSRQYRSRNRFCAGSSTFEAWPRPHMHCWHRASDTYAEKYVRSRPWICFSGSLRHQKNGAVSNNPRGGGIGHPSGLCPRQL